MRFHHRPSAGGRWLSLWLAGCSTSNKLSDMFGSHGAGAQATMAPPAETTGSISGAPATPASADAGLLGADPNDDLSLGKKQYRANNFGLAERYFRRAVETHPRDAEGWLGLAASYDRLRRFDLADRAYAQTISIVGADAGDHEQPGLFLHAARRLQARPQDPAGGPAQGPEEQIRRQ